MKVLTSFGVPTSPARVEPARRAPFRVAAVQERWHPDADEHRAALAEGVALAAGEGARLVCLQELTLSPYFAVVGGRPGQRERGAGAARVWADARRSLAGSPASTGSTSTRRSTSAPATAASASTPRSCAAPEGELVARTRKLHLPETAGYHEDR